ncbi:hypothetical protein VTN96DRAFT_9346 [Rasamsonia emersonii]|uniref:WIBG Mago-binding domain-containing protein n=1 Tax=Rasamsonia emersonii (strain ATCC 16479 / CBS 393.64 / IMI 116815) TaxID=1408163 RepID=A0A0F4YXZ7_RASE3|nr:hypothetical protein T310_2878 [Rasamsonia emersonii CBS 393.64]KKA23152.1 hypothetical protein T310_2878 [Rasamsonia emersonii CBS 393.64]
MSSAPQNKVSSSGIVVDAVTGERRVPSSMRADGSMRKEIRIRPGYRPPEDIEVYKNPAAEAWKKRGSFVPGAEGLKDSPQPKSGTPVSNKNAKRREAKKRAKAAGAGEDNAASATDQKDVTSAAQTNGDKTKEEQPAVDPEAEKEKKVRNLRKKLRQARELRDKKDKGESLLPEQLEKVIKINEIIRQLESLGFDADEEKKASVEG